MPDTPHQGKQTVNFARQTIKLYWQHVRKNCLMFLVVLTFIPASALSLATMVPYYLSHAIGQLASEQTDITSTLMAAVGWGLAGIFFNFIGFQLLARHEAFMHTALIDHVVKQLLDRDYAFFSNTRVGALTTKFNDFVRSYIVLQDLLIIRTLSFVISMSVGLALVMQQSLSLAIILFVLLLGLTVQVKVMLKIRQPYRQERKYLRSSITGEVADMLTNNLVVKTFAQEKQELASVTKKTKRFMKIFVKDVSLVTVDGSIRQFVTTFVQILAIIFALHQLQNGSISVATAIFALTFLQRIAAQIFTLGEMINGYDAAFLEAAPMTEILLQQNKISDSKDARNLTVTGGSISFANVDYLYEEGDQALDVFDYTISGGRKIGIVGHSGAGKTTITRLLLRFDDVTKGSITIDGQNIAEVTQESLRKAIAYVPQEPLLFHRSLAENIRYGKPDATDKEVERAAKLAHAHEFIKDLPKGYETLVGERGVKLSGGQRQRVAIARAILKDAPILVLDEATSALDSESEKLIQDALNKLMEGRTTIVIAHRLSTIQKMDRIIVLDKGAIVEEGSHADLLKQNGTYAKLWKHQSGGFLEE